MDTTDLLQTAELDFNEFENIIAENPNIITKTDSNERHLIHWLGLKGTFRYVTIDQFIWFQVCFKRS